MSDPTTRGSAATLLHPGRVHQQPRKRLEWGCWKARDIAPTGIVSIYIDLNVEGIHIGGGFWQFEGYAHFRIGRVNPDAT